MALSLFCTLGTCTVSSILLFFTLLCDVNSLPEGYLCISYLHYNYYRMISLESVAWLRVAMCTACPLPQPATCTLPPGVGWRVRSTRGCADARPQRAPPRRYCPPNPPYHSPQLLRHCVPKGMLLTVVYYIII